MHTCIHAYIHTYIQTFYEGGKRDPATDKPLDPLVNEPQYCSPWAKAVCRRKVYKCI